MGDFLNFRFSQQQKRSNSARLPSKMESWVQSWRPCANAFCDLSIPFVQSTAPATKKWGQVIRSAAPVTQNHFSKPEDLMLQNAPPSQEISARTSWLMCLLYYACHTTCWRILFKRPTPAIRLAHFWQNAKSIAPDKVLRDRQSATLLTSKCASCHNGVHFFYISTFKKGFWHFDFEKCFAPQRRPLFESCPGAEVFGTFRLQNMLRATTALSIGK